MKKIRLIELLCRREPTIPRTEHYARVLCGEILVDGERVRDPHLSVQPGVTTSHQARRSFVSRGGAKLDVVLEHWQTAVADRSFIDAGASTGGFTDCLLQRGAARVCAVEIGRNQLDYRLRTDARVVVLEQTNIISLRREALPFVPDAAVADLSLRSLRGAAAHILNLVSGKWMIALIKPQYELKNPPPSFHGVVNDPDLLFAVLTDLIQSLESDGVWVVRAKASPITGRKGNREFFFLLTTDIRRRTSDLRNGLKAAVESTD